LRPYPRFCLVGFRSLREVALFEALFARLSPAAKIPFPAAGSRHGRRVPRGTSCHTRGALVVAQVQTSAMSGPSSGESTVSWLIAAGKAYDSIRHCSASMPASTTTRRWNAIAIVRAALLSLRIDLDS
jgi:hypothetical protein